MKKLRGFCLLFALILVLQSLVLPVFAQDQTPSLAVSGGSATLDGQVPLENSQLLDTAKAVILYELNSQTLIHAWNPDVALDPSGMNKIMTALLALELGDPNAVVTVSRDALDSVEMGAVSAGLKAGEEITLMDLLYCMMVGSANDAAAVIAEHIGGGQAAFLTLMNERAAELGCTNTLFMNPNGLSHESQYTTARDLAKITAAALENETFVTLFSAVEYTVPATNKSEERKIVTTNYLMSKETVANQFDERVTGGKTGALSTTDRSLISTAESGDSRYLAVVMSAQGTVTANGLSVKKFGSFEETRALLDVGFSQYAVRQLLSNDRVMGQFSVSGGENDVIGCPDVSVIAAMPVDMAAEDISYQCTIPEGGLTAPIAKGKAIGTVEVWYGSVCVGQSQMIAMHDVDEEGVSNVTIDARTEDEVSTAWITWLLIGGIILLALVVVIGGVVMIVRLIRRIKLERRYKIRRKKHQRSR